MIQTTKLIGLFLLTLFHNTWAIPFIVQTLSSRYAIILGGFGYKYQDVRQVEVVKHNKVCSNVIGDIPNEIGRYLGDKSGMAEFVNGDSVLFCRKESCWKLLMGPNVWARAGGFETPRDRATSVAVDDTMLVMGGLNDDGSGINEIERYNLDADKWEQKPEWNMDIGRYSFCSVPLNQTAILIIGGYTSDGATASVEVLDTATGRKGYVADLPEPRYGHSCLLMEWNGREGILVSGGALTGRDVEFFDIEQERWESFPKLPMRTDGHKMVLVEGIPTVFSWEMIFQFNGKEWVRSDLNLSQSRSAFAVTTVPGHLVPDCQ